MHRRLFQGVRASRIADALFLAISLSPCIVEAATICLHDGERVTLQGIASSAHLTMANGSATTVWVIEIQDGICVDQPTAESQEGGRATIRRFQVIGPPPPPGVPIELIGTLSTGNVTQSYAVPNAIKVLSGRKLKPVAASAEQSARISSDAIQAPVPPFAEAAEPSTKTDDALRYCVMPKAQYGQYSSYDGGKSASSLLLRECPTESRAWIAHCERTSGTDNRECTRRALIFAQIVLKLFGK